jgi:hypothetical protein
VSAGDFITGPFASPNRVRAAITSEMTGALHGPSPPAARKTNKRSKLCRHENHSFPADAPPKRLPNSRWDRGGFPANAGGLASWARDLA